MNRMREFRRQLRSTVGRVLAYQISDGYGAAISGVLERVIRGKKVSDECLADVMAADVDATTAERDARAELLARPQIIPGGGAGKSIAMVTSSGMALYDLEYQPYCFSTLLLAQTMTALANDPDIGTIVHVINSPGGQVTGTQEAGDAVFFARQTKKVIAVINPLATSAAYWIASQATQIIAVPSADVGSIGVFMLHAECAGALEQAGIKPTFIFSQASPYKVEGNSLEPLGDEARVHYQSEVDDCYDDFAKAVARGRGVSVADVREKYGKGRTMGAPAAKKAGMIDAISTLDGAFGRLGVQMDGPESRRRGRAEAVISAGDIAAGDEAAADSEEAARETAEQPAEPEAASDALKPSRARRLALLGA